MGAKECFNLCVRTCKFICSRFSHIVNRVRFFEDWGAELMVQKNVLHLLVLCLESSFPDVFMPCFFQCHLPERPSTPSFLQQHLHHAFFPVILGFFHSPYHYWHYITYPFVAFYLFMKVDFVLLDHCIPSVEGQGLNKSVEWLKCNKGVHSSLPGSECLKFKYSPAHAHEASRGPLRALSSFQTFLTS